MAQNTVLIFIPDSLDSRLCGYLSGTKRTVKNAEVFHITSEKPSNKAYDPIGYIGHINECDNLTKDVSLFINGENKEIFLMCEEKYPVTQIIYDFKRFKNSDILYHNAEHYGEHFKNLSIDLRKHTHSVSENGRHFLTNILSKVILVLNICLNFLSRLNLVVQKSSTFTHFEESLKTMKWFLSTAADQKMVTPKMGNVIIAKSIDIFIGVFLTSYVMQYEDQIFLFVYNTFEGIVSSLKGLLLYLMGSPIGLKLNYGFNNFLGQFFLYHISLWRIFLQGAHPIFVSNFKYFMLPGALGFSYQIAMVSDIIAIATFHSYCIYVNAARIFNLQLKCLSSLWRVVIGRKFNPLRNRVDSCQYSHNQLFIGTLSFTILLFLLPTTAMYYVVFSIFRLVTLFIDRLLLGIRNALYNIPVYSIFLWILNTSSVAGNIHITWKSYDEDGNVTIEAKLEKLPFITSIVKFAPDSVSTMTNQRTLRDIFHGTITGTVL
ncbi:phosphatidylinositol N-acetylglucosaminyltransferase subunit Q [Diabrotica undecimpunctata]|uniref:phosphatidylinositol N-acetylglucosaminyltransferase subunit Q n=1 Tax=Diabrotica undecimpunctata TaxID=50387 RepID=UPI003B63A8C4